MNIIPIKLAYNSLRSQKTRTILTILGVSIGIAVVIAIMAAGRGLNHMVMGQLDIFSPDTISVEVKIPSTKQTSSENAFGQSTGITITTLNDKDLQDIARHPNIISAYGYQMGQAAVKYGDTTKVAILLGEGYNLQEVEKFELESGRMYTKEEEDSQAQVAIIGPSIKKTLFGDDDAIGKLIYLKGKAFRVIGMAKARGAMMGFDMDGTVLMPTKTLQKKIMGIDYVHNIIAKVKDRSLMASTVADITEIVRANHDITNPNKDDFAVNTMQEAADMLSSVVNGLTLLLVALVCVSLAVGGVGIMNIMYVSVTERTFEIGLRKAVGAKSEDILWQFLAESVLLTMGGGAVGIILGILLALIIYLIATYYNFSWVFSIPISSILLAVGFSGTVGLIFGLYPARKAASLDPIEALRKE